MKDEKIYDLRDPVFRPCGFRDPEAPMRHLGMADLDRGDTAASAIVRIVADLEETAAASGKPGIKRSYISTVAQGRTPFSRVPRCESATFTLDCMINNRFLLEHTIRIGIGRPTTYITLPDGRPLLPTEDAEGLPFLATQPLGTFRVPYVTGGLRLHGLKALCMARGRQHDRSYLCHEYPNGNLEVWRER